MADRWLTAYETRQLIAERRRDEQEPDLDRIQYAIIDYARTVLPARCRYMWEIDLDDDGPGQKRDARDVSIPPCVWDLTDDLKMDWDTGIFHLAGDQDGVTRYVKLVGLEFDGETVDRLWPSKSAAVIEVAPAGADALSTGTRSNAGRKRSAGWNDWIAYLAVAAPDIIREEGPEALIDKIATLMTADGLKEMPRSTIQPAAQAVIRLLEQKKL